jgi:hypothetical protein
MSRPFAIRAFSAIPAVRDTERNFVFIHIAAVIADTVKSFRRARIVTTREFQPQSLGVLASNQWIVQSEAVRLIQPVRDKQRHFELKAGAE